MSRGEDWCWEKFKSGELKLESGNILLYHRGHKRWIKKVACHHETAGGGRLHMKFGPKRLKVYLHRLVWMLSNESRIPEGMFVDHKDVDKFNNCPTNLKLTTAKESHQQGNKLVENGVFEYLLRWFGFLTEYGREPFYEEEILYVETDF